MAISVEKAVIAKLTKAGEKFEILVDPDKALEVKAGKEVPIDELLAVQDVYEDSKKALKSSAEKINKVFGTNRIEEVAKKIIQEGEVQLTTEQRRRIIEEKEKAIASIISREGINPQTNAPNPPERILKAMKQAKIKIELTKRPEEQVDYVLKAIKPLIPISIEKVKIAIKVPASFSAKAAGIIRNFGSVSKEEWTADGSYICMLELSAGMQQELYNKLNSLTHGEVQIKVIK